MAANVRRSRAYLTAGDASFKRVSIAIQGVRFRPMTAQPNHRTAITPHLRPPQTFALWVPKRCRRGGTSSPQSPAYQALQLRSWHSLGSRVVAPSQAFGLLGSRQVCETTIQMLESATVQPYPASLPTATWCQHRTPPLPPPPRLCQQKLLGPCTPGVPTKFFGVGF